MASRAGTTPAPSMVTVIGSTVTIDVCGIGDAVVVAHVKRSVRDGVGHLAGKWHVRLAASGDFGQWDLRLTGAFGRHVAMFRSTPDDLADSVARRLRAFLHGVVPPLLHPAPPGPRRPSTELRAVPSEVEGRGDAGGAARRPSLVLRRNHVPPSPQSSSPRPRPRLVTPIRNAS
jgi:hypothetical protein